MHNIAEALLVSDGPYACCVFLDLNNCEERCNSGMKYQCALCFKIIQRVTVICTVILKLHIHCWILNKWLIFFKLYNIACDYFYKQFSHFYFTDIVNFTLTIEVLQMTPGSGRSEDTSTAVELITNFIYRAGHINQSGTPFITPLQNLNFIIAMPLIRKIFAVFTAVIKRLFHWFSWTQHFKCIKYNLSMIVVSQVIYAYLRCKSQFWDLNRI